LESPETLQSATSVASSGTHYDCAEALAAFQSLSRADMARLVGYARYRMFPLRGRLHDADAEDLLHEALVKTFDDTRPWRHGVGFVQHLVGCMSSIAHNWFEKAGRYTELSDVQAPTPSIDSAMDARAATERLLRELREDAIACSALQAWLDGWTPAEMEKFLHIREDAYRAAWKRIRRRADVLFRSQEGAI